MLKKNIHIAHNEDKTNMYLCFHVLFYVGDHKDLNTTKQNTYLVIYIYIYVCWFMNQIV